MTAAEPPASLLGIPRELRVQILTHYFSSIHLRYTVTRPTHFISTITKPYRYTYTDPNVHNVLYVCKQLHDEARPVMLAEGPLRIPCNLHQFSDLHNLPNSIIEMVRNVTMQDLGTTPIQPLRKEDLDRFQSLETIQVDRTTDLSSEAFAALINRNSGMPLALRRLVFGPDWMPRFAELDRLLGQSVALKGQVRFVCEDPSTERGAAEVRPDRVPM